MSRVSSKSSISPSTTRGSSAIDLGKDSGVNMGEKTQPSVSTGGIGVTREIGNIGGISVSGGASVDISPIAIDISGSPNYEDPSKSTISIGAGAEIPGGILGVGGGVTINTSTGAVEGGSIGGEVLGIGLEISKSEDGLGLGISLQIPFTPISINLGFGFPNQKPVDTPPENPSDGERKTPNSFDGDKPNTWPTFDPNCVYNIYFLQHTCDTVLQECTGWVNSWSYAGYGFKNIIKGKLTITFGEPYQETSGHWSWLAIPVIQPPSIGFIQALIGPSTYITEGELGPHISSFNGHTVALGVTLRAPAYTNGIRIRQVYGANAKARIQQYVKEFFPGYDKVDFLIIANCWNKPQEHIKPSPTIPAPTSKSSPPFPNPPPRKQMDECCTESIKLLRQIHKGLGISKFPGQLPVTIIQEVTKKGEKPAEPAQEPIADFVDLLTWIFKRDDERWGQWEIAIDIKDTDITKEGDQGKIIRFPNLAESIAELEGQILSILTNVEALVALQVKTLAESGIGRQEAMKGYLASKAIIKYLAIKTVEKDFPHPLTYTPGAESIAKLIEESEGHVVGIDYEEKETLRDIFADLLQAAAIIRAVHWQRIDTKKDTKSQMLDLLKGSVELANKIGSPGAKISEADGKFDPSKDWEDFIDQVEDGFTNSTGITDLQNPYGKTRDRRPRIRQIGDNIAQAGEGK